MRRLLLLASAAAIASGASPAMAQEEDNRGVYLGLSGGVTSTSDIDVDYYDVGGTFGGTGTTDHAIGTIKLGKAAEFRATLGYDFGAIRSDFEIAYSHSRIKSLTLSSINGAAPGLTPADAQDVCDYLETTGCTLSGNTITYGDGGRVRQLSALANIWLDLPLGKAITPYAGGGVGVTGYQVDGEGKARFAWQLGAGVAVKLSGTVALTADFRHRETKGASLPWDNNSGTNVGTVRNNSFTAGLRFTF